MFNIQNEMKSLETVSVGFPLQKAQIFRTVMEMMMVAVCKKTIEFKFSINRPLNVLHLFGQFRAVVFMLKIHLEDRSHKPREHRGEWHLHRKSLTFAGSPQYCPKYICICNIWFICMQTKEMLKIAGIATQRLTGRHFSKEDISSLQETHIKAFNLLVLYQTTTLNKLKKNQLYINILTHNINQLLCYK